MLSHLYTAPSGITYDLSFALAAYKAIKAGTFGPRASILVEIPGDENEFAEVCADHIYLIEENHYIPAQQIEEN